MARVYGYSVCTCMYTRMEEKDKALHPKQAVFDNV